jgi:hypothetical protein
MDGAWLCVMTTGPAEEGARGQHVVSTRSTDLGRTWSVPVDVEPASGPEASYAVPYLAPSGRVYCFYNHNTDRVREVRREDGGVFLRVDSLGHYVFKFSDDHGRSWSDRRYDVPVREFSMDRTNLYGGVLKFFWNVGRPTSLSDGSVLLTLHKVGAMGPSFFARSEGAFLRSDNLAKERDPERIRFETLPEGDEGLRAPEGGGPIAEEQCITELSDGTLHCVYRTTAGWPACAYSRDRGRTWTRPEYLTYNDGGRRMKNPRAANFVWRLANGRYLYWFHNHGGTPARRRADWDPYADRNPAWMAAGWERETPEGRILEWSQPEVVLYDDDPFIRMSYPDLIEDAGRYFVTETQKDEGRVHELPLGLVQGLLEQRTRRTPASQGLLVEATGAALETGRVPMPRLPELHERNLRELDHRGKDRRAGFTLDLWVRAGGLGERNVVVDNRVAGGRGLVLEWDGGVLCLTLNDGRTECVWRSDPVGWEPGTEHHVAVIVDGGPKLILFVVDGVLMDGGEERQFGWGRFSPLLRTPHGAEALKVARDGAPRVEALRFYGRALTVSEAVGNARAGRPIEEGASGGRAVGPTSRRTGEPR